MRKKGDNSFKVKRRCSAARGRAQEGTQDTEALKTSFPKVAEGNQATLMMQLGARGCKTPCAAGKYTCSSPPSWLQESQVTFPEL